MDPVAAAVFASWKLDPGLVCALIAAAVVYLRGAWRRSSGGRIAAFLGGLVAILIALASPLDAFGGLLLQVHMIQHLLLIVVAPPLLLYGQPVIAMLRGLPRPFVREGLGPFLRWRALQRTGRALVHPITGWAAMAAAIAVWHAPPLYELGLHSVAWHEFQHGCFFFGGVLFWWPVVQVLPGHAVWPRWAMIPYLVSADLVNTALSAWLTFSDRVVYPTYASAPRLWGSSALGDQSMAGAIMWVPGSIAFLIPAVAIAMGLLTPSRLQRGQAAPRRPARAPHNFHPQIWQQVGRAVMFLLALAIVIDGFSGTQVSAINLAGILPWTYWRGFAIIALLVAGNVFCAVCPFTVARSLASRFLTAHRRWPRALRSKWLALGLFATYLWAYEALRLWDRPSWTAWIVIGYFVTAFLVDSIFEGASFCKYVCPIGQFHFVNSFVSPLEVTVRKPQVCTTCTTHDCLHSCGLQLLQPEKRGNFDCTFCLKCIPACPTQNVAILPASPARRFLENRKLLQRRDVLALALVLVFGAFANAAGMTAPVMTWMHSWHARLGITSMLSLHAIYYVLALIALPAIAWIICRRRFILTLIPIGFAMWLAHFVFHLATGWPGLAAFQFLALDAGLLFTLYLLWRIGARWTEALGPIAIALALYAAGFWIVLQPMERMA